MIGGRFLPAFVLAAALAATPAHATRPGEVAAFSSGTSGQPVVSASAPGALPEPRDWRCDLIRPEYREWLRSGHKESDWRFAGKTYRVADTGELYDWNDWLRWAHQARCAGFVQKPEPRLWTGAAIWAAGMALLFAAFGSAPDSPG